MGGAQARQHILLVPEGQGHATVTVGWVDIPERKAELRTFGCLLEVHSQRHANLPFALHDEGYDNFLFRTRKFFEAKAITVVEVDTAPVLEKLPESPSAAERRSGGVGGLVVALVGLGIAAAAVWYVFMR
jgi:hypothetical protein